MPSRRLARLSGRHGATALEQAVRSDPRTVQTHYAALFEDAAALGSEKGSLVFTGGEDDPETLETLRQMGFRQASEIIGDDPRLAFWPLCGNAQRQGQTSC